MGFYDIIGLDGSPNIEPITPFFAINTRKEKNITDYIADAARISRTASMLQANNQITNYALVKGIHYQSQDPYLDYRTQSGTIEPDTAKIVVNDYYRYVDAIVGKAARFRPGTIPVPATNEFQDKQGARMAKMVIEDLDSRQDIDSLIRDAAWRAVLGAECFFFTWWDRNKGPISERWLRAHKKYGTKRMKFNRDGWVYEPEMPEYIGDLSCFMPLNWMVSLDPQDCPEKCNWVVLDEWVHKEELKLDYPKFEKRIDDIPADENARSFDLDSLTVRSHEDCLLVRTFVHKSHRHLRQGYYAKVVGDLILEEDDNPLSDLPVLNDSEWGDLPFERMVDLRIPGQLHAASSFNMIKNLVDCRNKLLTMFNRNLMLTGHPKIVMHKNAKCSVSSFANDATIVKWGGSQPWMEPKIVNYATFPPGLFEFYQLLGGEADKLMKHHPISQGTPPAGIKAGVALRLLQEVEDQQLTNMVKELTRFVQAVARKRLAVFGKGVMEDRPEDKRMMQLVGRDNQDLVEKIDIEALTKPWNIRVEQANQMARSPAARAQQVIDLLEVAPGILTREQVVDALELVSPEKVTDPAQSAVAAAEYVNELAANGKELPKPRPGENYLVKWNVHMAFYQRQSFNSLPEKAQKAFTDMMLGLEFLMSEHVLKNPAYSQALLSLPGYPAFYDTPPEQRPQMMPPPGQSAPPPGPPPGMPQQMMPPADQRLAPPPPLTNAEIGR